jgi:signal transduction histidine kinase
VVAVPRGGRITPSRRHRWRWEFDGCEFDTPLVPVQMFTAILILLTLVLVALVGESRRRLALEAKARGRAEAEVAAAIENERMRLGTELHEGLGQELAAIGYLMAALRKTLPVADTVQASEAMRLEDLITRSIERTRVLAKAFYPVEMETLGLLGSLEGMACNAARSFEIECRVRTDREWGASAVRGSKAIQLFRIAEEAIHYEVEQDRAQHIEISVAGGEDSLVLSVAGDGAGVAGDVDNADSADLRMMRYRAGVIGARLDVSSRRGGGTTVRCSVPLAEAVPPLALH